MQALTLDDVSDKPEVFNVVLNKMYLSDLKGLKRSSRKYRRLLPELLPLYRYIQYWHTNMYNTDEAFHAEQWYHLDGVCFTVTRSAWEEIFGNNDVDAAKRFAKADAIAFFAEYLEDLQYGSNALDYLPNAVEIEQLAAVKSLSMMQLMEREMFVEPAHCKCGFRLFDYESDDEDQQGFDLQVEAIRIYAAVIGEGARAMQNMLQLLNRAGVSNHTLAVQMLTKTTVHDNGNTLFFSRHFINQLYNNDSDLTPDEDPIWAMVNTNDVLVEAMELQGSEMDTFNFYNIEVYPFHNFAAGYEVQHEKAILALFERHFMHGSIDERNFRNYNEETVLEILYRTRPLNRTLLTVLNKKKHSDEFFEE